MVVDKLVILGILFLPSFILALRAVVLAASVILGISFITSFILALRVVSDPDLLHMPHPVLLKVNS